MSGRADIKVGFACNNRCVFCAQGQKRSDVAAVPREELLARLAQTRAPGRGLVLTGGEPTVRKDLHAIVAAARALGFRPIQVQTNGRMLSYPGVVARLVAEGVDEFSPALHGPTAALHDSLTRAEGSFDQTLAGIRNALASGAVVVTNTVAVKRNLEHLADTIALLGEAGVRQAQIALVHPVGTASEMFGEVAPQPSEAAPWIHRAIDRGRALGMRVVVEAMPLCLMRGYEDAVVEEEIPETTVVDLDGAPFAFSEWRRGEGKAKGPPCERCSKTARCEGPWREYPEHFGWDEYTPF